MYNHFHQTGKFPLFYYPKNLKKFFNIDIHKYLVTYMFIILTASIRFIIVRHVIVLRKKYINHRHAHHLNSHMNHLHYFHHNYCHPSFQ